uniref:VLRF1 domain-containing protein n=1 Tax=Ciona intestinalis TaxID=7719 RepID=F6WVX7_CIOIN
KVSKPGATTVIMSHLCPYKISLSENQTLQCLTCKCELSERENQTEHYKGEWHRYNLKLRLLGLPAIGEDEFGGMSVDDLSISGSDSDFDSSPASRRRFSLSLCKSDAEEEDAHDEQFDNRRPKLYLQNKSGEVLSIYKKVLYSKTINNDEDVARYASSMIAQACNQTWVVILLSAGHFAAAVFEGSKVAAHKTFHRYIVRAKRGTVQSSNDAANRNSTAKSAGASLRRHNEQVLEENIKQLLLSWNEEIKNAALIFIRIPQYRKGLFYSGKDPLFNSKDSRIRTIPFVTRRPTFNEVQRVHQELFSVAMHVFGRNKLSKNSMPDILTPPRASKNKRIKNPVIQPKVEEIKTLSQTGSVLEKYKRIRYMLGDSDIELITTNQSVETSELKMFETKITNYGNKKKNKKKKKKKQDNNTPTSTEKEKVEKAPAVEAKQQRFPAHIEDFLNQMFTACKTSNLNLIRDSCDAQSSDPGNEQISHVINFTIDSQGNTLLHVAAKTGLKEIIFTLLEAGADPAIKNFTSFLPYCLCPNKEARNIFRRFRSKYPDKFDYKSAQIPSPLSDVAEEEMKKKKSEKKKMQRLDRKLKERVKREEEEKKKEEQDEKERFLALSDREKRLIAIERRMMNSHPSPSSNERRCFTCAESLFAKVPFEYLDFQFCSVICLKTHKKTKTKS